MKKLEISFLSYVFTIWQVCRTTFHLCHLTHSLINHSKTVPNSKKQQTTTDVAIKGHLDTDCIENIVEKGEIAHFEQFHLFPQCFPKVFLFKVLK